MNFITDFLVSQKFEQPDLWILVVLTFMEGILSIDNAIVLGLLAKRLPKSLQPKALNWGMMLAFIFRFAAIFAASLLLRWTIVKLLGGGYLAYIAIRHLFFDAKHDDSEHIKLDAHGHPILVEESGEELTPAEREEDIKERVPVYIKPEEKGGGTANLWPTVASIGLTDIAFAVDSILAAIALVGSSPDPTKHHPKLWLVITGGALGMIVLRFAAGMFIKLLEKFPRFELSAYLLVLLIGSKLLFDWGLNSDWSFDQNPWAASMLGTSKQSFEKLETGRKAMAKDYEDWLSKRWIFKIEPHHDNANHKHDEANHKEDAEHKEADKAATPKVDVMPGDAQPAQEAAAKSEPVPHLLDFHSFWRPESLTFWGLMLVSFLVGFLPPRKKPHSAAK